MKNHKQNHNRINRYVSNMTSFGPVHASPPFPDHSRVVIKDIIYNNGRGSLHSIGCYILRTIYRGDQVNQPVK